MAPDYFPDDFVSYMSMIQYLEEAPMTASDLHVYTFKLVHFVPSLCFISKKHNKEISC